MSDQKLLNGFRRCEKVISNAALGAPEHYVFSQLIDITESMAQGRHASIFKFNAQTQSLHQACDNNLPDFYNKAIDGVEIGEYIGSCGAAAYLAQTIIIDNIQTHPNWAAFRGIAEKAGLSACWSVPIMSSKGQILGTFAVYSDKVGKPSDDELEILTMAAHIVGVVIEKAQLEQKLDHAETHDQLTELPTRTVFESAANKRLKVAVDKRESYTLLYLELNKLHFINEEYGHSMGDRILSLFAELVLREMRGTDICSRIAGNEFVIALAETTSRGAAVFVRRLDALFSEAQDSLKLDERVELIVGLAELKEGKASTLNELIIGAEKQMREHKKALSSNEPSSNLVELVPQKKSNVRIAM
jgi:diguanylate cyclase (GGDEF)-like protein